MRSALLLAPHAGSRVSFAEPGAPVLLAPAAAKELAAAVGAALDNVRVHAGQDAQAWILVEDWPDEVIVTVRDDGPGIAEGGWRRRRGRGGWGSPCRSGGGCVTWAARQS